VADVGFDKGTVSIKLNGDVNEDTDEFDDGVILQRVGALLC